MGVYRTDYIVYGWKFNLSKMGISSNTLFDLSEELYEAKHRIELVRDEMMSRYAVLAIVLFQTDLFNPDGNDFYFEFKNVDLSLIERDKEELFKLYNKHFGPDSKFKMNEEPKSFIFTHIY